jgi:tight adherence protein C
MSDPDLLIVLGAAGVAGLLGWMAVRRLIASLPVADRRWHERAPLAWRLVSPVTRVIAGLAASVLPARWRAAEATLLRQSGLDLVLEAGELLAGRVAAAALLGLLAWVASLAFLGLTAPSAAIGAPIGDPGNGSRWQTIAIIGAMTVGWMLPAAWVAERRATRLRAIGRALPFYLDVITLSVESGANLTGALQHAVSKGPQGPLQAELERVLRDVRAGRTRADALRAMADRLGLASVASWVAALVAAERHGSSLGPILRAQAEQRRQERFQHAEKLAMKAPVKMLFPLLVFIFPCTFVLLFFPIAVRLLEEGLLR